jgi:hypothetical protein
MDTDSVRPIAQDWLGRWVVMEYWAGPEFDYDDEDKVVQGRPEARTAAVYLEWVGPWGVEVRRLEDDPVSFFPWSAVIRIEGPTREEMEREQAEQPEQAASSPDRQEVMDLLTNAETPSEAADAKAAADGWLLTHPSDGDVRMAREQLEARFPEGTDPEEASPT